MQDYSQHGEQKIIIDFFNKLDTKDLRFLDIGANDGVSFSNTHALAQLGWSGVCFEPSKLAFEKLKNVYKENPKIEIYNAGISNITGKQILHESRDWVNSEAPVSVLSCIDPSQKLRFTGMNWEETECDFYRFSDFVKEFNPQNLNYDFISIDCEGHDFIVLNEISEVINSAKLICVEFISDEDIQRYTQFFSKWGFKVFDKTKDNIFFSKSKKQDLVIIDCFVSSDSVLQKLREQILKFKSIGFNVLLISNTLINTDTLSLVDHFIYDSRNQLFEKEYTNVQGVNFLETIFNNGKPAFTTTISRPGLQRHGLSVLVNLHNGVNLAKSLGYENFWRFEVDDIFGSESMKWILSTKDTLSKSNKKAILYYNHYQNEPSNISFHFMYWNIDYFLEKIPQIKNEEDYITYLTETYGNLNFEIAEQFIYNNLKRKGDSEVLVKDGSQMELDFPDTRWNTEQSASNLDSKYRNCITTLYIDSSDRIWLLSHNKSQKDVRREIHLQFDGSTEKIEHHLAVNGSWSFNQMRSDMKSFDVLEDGELIYSEENKNIQNRIQFL